MTSMRSRTSLRLAAAAALAPAPVLAGLAVPAEARPAQPAPPQGVELRSSWENAHPACDISRDGGLSTAMPNNPGQSFWLFGDLGISGEGCGYKSLGTHAAISVNTPGQVPVVNEIPTPGLNGVPGPAIGALPNGNRGVARFFPNPTGLLQNDGTPCSGPDGSAMLTWPGPATKGPNQSMNLSFDGAPVTVDGSDLLFIFFGEVCVEKENQETVDMITERVGMVAWDPSINSIVARWILWDGTTDADTSTVRAQSMPTASPYFIDGVGLVTFGAACGQVDGNDCLSGETYLVGVFMDDLRDPLGYKYFVGGSMGWSYNQADATPLKPASTNGRGPYDSGVGDFSHLGKGLLMYDKTSNVWGTHYQLWRQPASDPLGTWNFVKEGDLPEVGCSVGYGCYFDNMHPELSTASDVMVSVFDSNSGEIEMSSIGAIP